jgi:predicted RNase H-like HicB family nuclease
MNPRAEPWTQIPGQAPGNLTQKTHPLNPPLLPREGEAEGGGEFIKMEKSKSLTYKLLLHKEPEGEYTVTVPALPGCITYGENIDHAIEIAREAIELYISELKEKGMEIPDDSATLEYSINLIDA